MLLVSEDRQTTPWGISKKIPKNKGLIFSIQGILCIKAKLYIAFSTEMR